ncbi:MAG TPA: ABC-F family ATP-binding cassette domain-containing protein [Polyangiales bacterium]|nr:ABC-F family ATP-binding cassette domain-containing protein [Polyangiales bacterium]
MAILLTARGLSHAFSQRPLFQGISFTVSEGDRIGLIGPNGAGKSTLLKILAGQLHPDSGELAQKTGLRVGYLAQSPTFEPDATVRSAVAAGLPHVPEGEDWEAQARVDEVLAKLQLNGPEVLPNTPIRTLSGGWQKRVALARELVRDPDLLLLDEPTNHLDVESILWLERQLASAQYGTITITHDRMFLQKVSRRIFELDRRNENGLLEVDGDYATYVERKADAMAAQEQREQALRNTLRRETEWLRRGPAARTTKQTARIERAGDLADEVAALGGRNRVRKAEIELEARGRKTKQLILAKDISKRYATQPVFEHVDLLVGPGTRLALLGPNGCGKSTLLDVLVGKNEPTDGTVERAPDLAIAHFEQQRESLDPDKSVADSLIEGSDMVDYRGSRLHRYGYLERFLFRSEHMNVRVGSLSGGEQSRLLIARLMLQPADIMVLDEPTNDLDFETLDVLQTALTDFPGAVLLVSHDRYFVDQVATQILAFHTAPGERGRTTMFADLSQWQSWHATQRSAAEGASAKRAPAEARTQEAPKPKKFSYKDQRDWDTLEARILTAETELAELEAKASSSAVVSDASRALELHQAHEAKRVEIDRLYARWAELESLRGGG